MSGARKFAVCCLLGLSAGLAGCAVEPVKAWERGDLARWQMAWETDAGLSDYRRHAQFSKEAGLGQLGTGGGGCGCN